MEAKPERRRPIPLGGTVPAGARITRTFITVGRARHLGDLLSRASTPIHVALILKPLESAFVSGVARRLEDRALVPVESEPLVVSTKSVGGAWDDPWPIEIFDAHHDSTLLLACAKPGDEGGPGVP